MGGRQLHLVVDGGRAHVERPAEDEREAEHVVDLVGVVAAPGGDDRVGSGLARIVVGDLRIGVAHREDDGLVRHLLEHLLAHQVADRHAEEDVGAVERLGQGALLGLLGEEVLVGVHALGAALVANALAVDEHDVLGLDAHLHDQLGDGDGGGAGARDHDLQVGQFLALQQRRVDQPGGGDDRGAVLVVVEDGDVHGLLQLLLDVEAFGSLDVLEVDAAEGRFEHLAGADDLVGVLAVQLDVEHVDVSEALEEHPLALHHRLAGQGADVAEPEDRGAVADHRHQVAPVGVLVAELGVGGDGVAGHRHAGGVGQRELALRQAGLGGHDLGLARSS